MNAEEITNVLSTLDVKFDELAPRMAAMHIGENVTYLIVLIVTGVLLTALCVILRKTYLKQKEAGVMDYDRRSVWSIVWALCMLACVAYVCVFMAQGSIWVVDIVGWCRYPKAKTIEALLEALGNA